MVCGRVATMLFVLFILIPSRCNGYSNRLFNSIDINDLEINQNPEIYGNGNGNLTIFELVTLSQLQKFIGDVIGIERYRDPFWISTGFLRNLLDASKWNAGNAKRKFRKVMTWRSDMRANKEKEISDILLQRFRVEMNGFDKEGCPILILPFGEWSTYRSYLEKMKSITKAKLDLGSYFTRVMEQLLEKVKRKWKSDCSQIVFVVDMSGYTYHHSSGIKVFLDAIKRFDRNFPGVLKIAYLINSTTDFLHVAQAFKTAVPWDLRRKSFIYTDKSFWKDAILQNIDKSQLSPEYGGTNFFYQN